MSAGQLKGRVQNQAGGQRIGKHTQGQELQNRTKARKSMSSKPEKAIWQRKSGSGPVQCTYTGERNRYWASGKLVDVGNWWLGKAESPRVTDIGYRREWLDGSVTGQLVEMAKGMQKQIAESKKKEENELTNRLFGFVDEASCADLGFWNG